MKKLILILILTASAFAQFGRSPVNIAPDCVVSFKTSATGRSNDFDNRDVACTEWDLVYTNTGFSALSIELDQAPDSGGQAGAYVIWPAGSVSGTLPLTATTQSQVSTFTFAPHVSINVTSVTGTGEIRATAYGWRSGPNGDASSGSGVIFPNVPGKDDPCANPHVLQTRAAIADITAATKIIANGGGTTQIYVCGISMNFGGTAAGSAKFTSGTGTACNLSPANLSGTYLGTLGQTINIGFAGRTVITPNVAATDFCISLTGGTSPTLGGFIEYVLQ